MLIFADSSKHFYRDEMNKFNYSNSQNQHLISTIQYQSCSVWMLIIADSSEHFYRDEMNKFNSGQD
jgi:hypothetical protein